jgi:hypothetical protein
MWWWAAEAAETKQKIDVNVLWHLMMLMMLMMLMILMMLMCCGSSEQNLEVLDHQGQTPFRLHACLLQFTFNILLFLMWNILSYLASSFREQFLFKC